MGHSFFPSLIIGKENWPIFHACNLLEEMHSNKEKVVKAQKKIPSDKSVKNQLLSFISDYLESSSFRLRLERPISRYFFIPGSGKLRFHKFSEPGNPGSEPLLL